jgi:hypothetical protein
MDPRYLPNASALLDEEAIGARTAQMIHGRGAALVPAASRAPKTTGPSRPGQTSAQVSPEQLHDAMRNMLKSKYDEMGVAVDDDRLEELTQFAIAKRQGRLARQMNKQQKAALAKYFGALVGKETAENHFTRESQRLQSAIAAAIADRDDEKQMHYRDQLAALKQEMVAKQQRAAGYRDIIERKFQIPAQYLQNPVSLFAFINDDTDDDFSDLLGDDEP